MCLEREPTARRTRREITKEGHCGGKSVGHMSSSISLKGWALYRADRRQEDVADFLPSTDNTDLRLEECGKVMRLVSIFQLR
jgi:hypothetical protein